MSPAPLDPTASATWFREWKDKLFEGYLSQPGQPYKYHLSFSLLHLFLHAFLLYHTQQFIFFMKKQNNIWKTTQRKKTKWKLCPQEAVLGPSRSAQLLLSL